MTTQADLNKQAKDWDAAYKEADAADDAPIKGVQVAGLGDTIKKGAKAFGSAILGGGTAKDATAGGQEAYRQHVIDASTNGETPKSREDFFKQKA